MKKIFNNKMDANITLLTLGNKGNILGILKRSIVANIRADHIRSLAFISPNLNNSKVVQGEDFTLENFYD